MLDDSDIALVNDWLYQNGSEVVCDAFDRIKKELVEAQKTPTNNRSRKCRTQTLCDSCRNGCKSKSFVAGCLRFSAAHPVVR
jgi:hypothetical protein